MTRAPRFATFSFSLGAPCSALPLLVLREAGIALLPESSELRCSRLGRPPLTRLPIASTRPSALRMCALCGRLSRASVGLSRGASMVRPCAPIRPSCCVGGGTRPAYCSRPQRCIGRRRRRWWLGRAVESEKAGSGAVQRAEKVLETALRPRGACEPRRRKRTPSPSCQDG